MKDDSLNFRMSVTDVKFGTEAETETFRRVFFYEFFDQRKV